HLGEGPVSAQLRAWIAMMAAAGCTPALAATAFENDYVKVSRNEAPCAHEGPGCRDRVILAMSPLELRSGGKTRKMDRGEIAVFKAGDAYEPPASGAYYE